MASWPPPPPASGPVGTSPADGAARAGWRPEWRKAEHTLAGRAYIVLSYLSAAILVLAGFVFVVAPEVIIGRAPERGVAGGAAVAVFLVAALIAFIALGVSRFSTWAWWLTMVFVVLGGFMSLVGIFDPTETPVSRAYSVVLLVLNGIWLHYFWTRRADF